MTKRKKGCKETLWDRSVSFIFEMSQLSHFSRPSFIKPTSIPIKPTSIISSSTKSQSTPIAIILPSDHTTSGPAPQNVTREDEHRYTIASSSRIAPFVSKPNPRLPTPIPVPMLNRAVLAEVQKQIKDLKSIEHLGVIIPHSTLKVNPFDFFDPFSYLILPYICPGSILQSSDHVQVHTRVSFLILCAYLITTSLIVNL